ncbi:hypothetical protein [Crucivirus-536]|nr:hypothetical protein [Crucivirus-536]
MKRQHEESTDEDFDEEEDMEIPPMVQEACDHFVAELDGYLTEAKTAIAQLKIFVAEAKQSINHDAKEIAGIVREFEKFTKHFKADPINPDCCNLCDYHVKECDSHTCKYEN